MTRSIATGAENDDVGSFRCSACDASLDRSVCSCPECGTEFPVAYRFADQDTEPFAIVRPRRSLLARRSGLVALLAVVAISTRPTFSAESDGGSSPTAEIGTTRTATADSEMVLLQATPTATASPTHGPAATSTPTSTPHRW